MNAPSSDASRAAPGRFLRSAETALFAALLLGLAWAPFWLGGDRMIPWGVNAVVFPALAILYEAALLAGRAPHPVGVAVIAGPTLLFALAILAIVAQMTPGAPATLAHPVWAMAAEALGRPIAARVSTDPDATRLALLRLLTLASVFWLSLQLCRDPRRGRALLAGLVAIVAAYAALGLALALEGRSEIPWFDAPPETRAVRATFVNRNHFATYAGLGLVAALGLLGHRWRVGAAQAGVPDSRPLLRAAAILGPAGAGLALALLTIALALFGAGSRGGALAAGVGVAAVVALGAARRRGRRAGRDAALVTLAVGALAFALFGDVIAGRLASSGLGDANRLAVLAIMLRALADAPLQGFGYGAFAAIFPLYRDGSIDSAGVWDKAHNTWAETLLGLGLPAGAALIGAIVWLGLRVFAGALRRRRDATPSIVGAAACLLVGVHALVDFSLQIEAIGLTFAAMLGAAVAGSESSRRRLTDAAPPERETLR